MHRVPERILRDSAVKIWRFSGKLKERKKISVRLRCETLDRTRRRYAEATLLKIRWGEGYPTDSRGITKGYKKGGVVDLSLR